MSQDQVNSLIRSFIAAFGGVIGGWFLHKGWLNQQQLEWLAANWPAILGLAGSLGAGVWAAIAHKQVNMVATVAAMPEVSHVATTATASGALLAAAAHAAAGPSGTVKVA